LEYTEQSHNTVISRQLANHTQPKYCHDHAGDGSTGKQELTPMLLTTL